MNEYKGVIHIHSRASDGDKSFSEIIWEAANLGLDFLIPGDHNAIDPICLMPEHRLLIVPGLEYTPKYKEIYDDKGSITGYESGPNHLLAIGVNQAGSVDHQIPQNNIDQTLAAGGLAFIAHPADYWLPWNDWTVERYTGLEIWTFLSDWAESSFNSPSPLFAYRNPDAVLQGPPEQALRRWDNECQHRRIVGIGSVDMHSKPQNVGGVQREVFPPEVELSSIRTHILSFDPLPADSNKAIQQLVSAIGDGHCYTALDSLFPSDGFRFCVETNKRVFIMGDELWPDPREPLTLLVQLPQAAEVRVLKDGHIYHKAHCTNLSLIIHGETGVFRIETRIKGHPWIFSNPIYVRCAKQLNKNE
jgi:hypothetical protein